MIDLAWENDDPNATAIQVLWSTGGAPYQALPLLDGDSSGYPDTGLTPNTPYSFEVITEGPGGSSSTATAEASTPSVDAPSGLTATGISTSEIDLQWTNNSTTATGIEIDRWSNTNPVQAIATGLPSDTTTYPDTTGLQDNTQYWYEVKATGGSAGDSSFSPPASAWTIPAAPSGLSASAVSAYEVDLSWTNNSSGSPAFTVERSSDGSPFTPIGTTAAGATSYQDLTVTDNATYSYQVVAVNGAGASSAASNTVTVSTPQATLDNLTATGVSDSEIDLTWTDNSDGTAPVYVWRSLDDSTWTQIASLPAGTNGYHDTTGLAPDTIYYYYLSTTGSSSTASSNQTAGVTLPTAPTGLTATPGTDDGDVQLSWSDSANDNDGYEIFGSSDGSGFTVVADVDAGTTSYDDLMAADGVTDYYQVAAFGLGGDSTPTATASATPIAPIQSCADVFGADSLPVYQADASLPFSIDEQQLVSAEWDANNNAQMAVASFTQPQHGTLTDNGDGALIYQGDPGYMGPDSFQYFVTDQYGAMSNVAVAQIQVDDPAPLLQSAVYTLPQATDDGELMDAAAPVTGYVGGGETAALTFSVVSGPSPSQGTFQLNAQTGQFTYTPDPNATSAPTVTVVFQGSSGAMQTNLATLVFPGYSFSYDDDGQPIMTSDALPVPLPEPYSVAENGTLESSGAALADWANLGPDQQATASIGAVIAQPQHGSLVSSDSSGDFVYQPNPGFVGIDYFTYSVVGASGCGGYGTAYIGVTPVKASLEFNELGASNPQAMIPSAQFPTATGALPYAELTARVDGLGGPPGAQATLSINASVLNDLDVYDGVPGESGSRIILGKDAGSDTYTWNLDGYDPELTSFYVVGLQGSGYDQAQFALSVTPPVETFGFGGNSAPAVSPASPPPPATQPLAASQPATVAGNSGYLAAFDGTSQSKQQKYLSDIVSFEANYAGTQKNYYPGVGTAQWGSNTIQELLATWIGGPEAGKIVNVAWTDVVQFYQNPINWGVPLDTVGWSRGCFEAIMLTWNVSRGIPIATDKMTADGEVYWPNASVVVDQRFVGLISPVGQMGPTQENYWKTSLPAGVKYFAEASDGRPIHPLFPESVITAATGTTTSKQMFQGISHGNIGYSEAVLEWMMAQAAAAGVPLKGAH